VGGIGRGYLRGTFMSATVFAGMNEGWNGDLPVRAIGNHASY